MIGGVRGGDRRTGVAVAVRELADELRQVAGDFATATASVTGALLVVSRRLPHALGRRTFSRFDKGKPDTGRPDSQQGTVRRTTVARQREELGSVLWERLLGSTTAIGTSSQDASIVVALDGKWVLLQVLGEGAILR